MYSCLMHETTTPWWWQALLRRMIMSCMCYTLYHSPRYIISHQKYRKIAEEEKSNKMLKRKTGANLVGLKNWLEIISCQFWDLVFCEEIRKPWSTVSWIDVTAEHPRWFWDGLEQPEIQSNIIPQEKTLVTKLPFNSVIPDAYKP